LASERHEKYHGRAALGFLLFIFLSGCIFSTGRGAFPPDPHLRDKDSYCALEALESMSSWALISKLIEAIRRYGKPRAVRTDNEVIFISRTFRFALTLLGIRHQRTDPGCPWQNGRAERFFGTLKEKLDRLAVDSLEGLNEALVEFRFFYNHVRPHQNLAGLTPSESWTGEAPFTRLSAHEYWFEAWDGLLSGYYWRR
jgi:putative transposase